jgi:plastocyanin
VRIHPACIAASAVLAACGGSSSDANDQPTIHVAAAPSSVALHPGDTTQLGAQASVTGLAPGAGTAIYVSVDWQLQEPDGGTLAAASSNGETFTVTYTAPAKAGVYHVVASDHADPSINSVITVTVTVN